MDFLFWSITIDYVAKLLIGITALLVHHKVEKEGKIDTRVIKEMKLEQLLGSLAIILIIASYVLYLYA